MLSNQTLLGLKNYFKVVVNQRNLGVFAPAFNKASDPIQQLFLDKIREYKNKSGGGTKLVDPSPDIQKELTSELEKLSRQYGGGAGVDMTKFPTFKFTDPAIDSIKFESK
ncbi:hypothetical protein PPYR_00579 [Photinus pyralis]|uniref:ATP synthase-coupling factor 6, mitochondrial n=1 Tax=Photinus pyralis TaxID=7054 RepID=A0A5N4B1X7_PHOPY|nr:hypothetical protein PPYR_00579 [Photinus pyralis]